jgi:biotin synthesis protein BioG
MNKQWLSRSGSASLLLVFGGWGLGVAPFADMTGTDDVLFVDDYISLSDDLPETTEYDDTTLLAYSFGVVSAAHWLAQTGLKPDRKVAANGTLYPADELKGTHPQTVSNTIDQLTQSSFAKFCKRCGHHGAPPNIDIVAAQSELDAIISRGPAPETTFDRIWISDRDRIIPTQAQLIAWEHQEQVIKRVSGPHQPFKPGQSWQEWLI